MTAPPPSPPPSPPRLWIPLLAAALALVVVHGIGRFAYTPLLPLLVGDGFMGLDTGAAVATWNYVGYLLGAMLAIRLHEPAQIRRILPLALLINAACTLAQGFTDNATAFLVLRLINGISNGVVFVQAPALVLEWLARHGLASLSGLMYFGVGGGLLLSNALANLPAELLHGAARWWPMALAALPLALWSARQLAHLDRPQAGAPAPAAAPRATALLDRASLPVFMAYAGAGLGYILPTTFLPVVAREQLPAGHWLQSGAWLILALCTLAAAWLWNRLGTRMGDRNALVLNYVVQGIGVAGPLLWPGTVGILACALMVGSTFLGSVLLTQRLARALHPHQGPRISAALITLYGFAQLTGPWMARMWLERGGSMSDTYWLGAGALVWATVWTLKTQQAPEHAGAPKLQAVRGD
ncbi:YbfB/YjiJ family MFS transporter [Azoarcus olearius]|uniref:Permease member of the MFS transporters n=1 Tax=Azoarcus sp. (strain BH72) TaxID=418699 RepID=A1K1E4_AZOSB|nr:YbfB/YjiJ family MFS transporter [Azoarcus olearius]CAL92649.1 putative permease member of the MFS transporters [Azoarcus olearius]